MHLFYCPAAETENNLDEQESIHALKVLRLKPGDLIQLIDGKGGLYQAKISGSSGKKCQFEILEKKSDWGKRPYYIHLALAPTKNIDRTEWFVEKAVEFGVDEISFLQCEHSERKNINTERVEKIAVQAMKQSLKAYLPKLNPLKRYKDFIREADQSQKFIAHLESGEKKYLQSLINKNSDYCVLIGPEGDFSPDEIKFALEKNFIPVSLGESRLRTETAGVAAVHILNLVNTH